LGGEGGGKKSSVERRDKTGREGPRKLIIQDREGEKKHGGSQKSWLIGTVKRRESSDELKENTNENVPRNRNEKRGDFSKEKSAITFWTT